MERERAHQLIEAYVAEHAGALKWFSHAPQVADVAPRRFIRVDVRDCYETRAWAPGLRGFADGRRGHAQLDQARPVEPGGPTVGTRDDPFTVLGVALPAQGMDESRDVPVPASEVSFVCPDCEGSPVADAPCPSCRGAGKLGCAHCGGGGQQVRVVEDTGLEFGVAHSAAYMGRMALTAQSVVQGSHTTSLMCRYCKGVGTITCDVCTGHGRMTCARCSGLGGLARGLALRVAWVWRSTQRFTLPPDAPPELCDEAASALDPNVAHDCSPQWLLADETLETKLAAMDDAALADATRAALTGTSVDPDSGPTRHRVRGVLITTHYAYQVQCAGHGAKVFWISGLDDSVYV